MNKEEFQNKVRTVLEETGVSVPQAVKLVEEEYMNEVELRLQREEDNRNKATEDLLRNPESKTVIVPIHEFISKEQAMAIAHSTIKVNKFYFLSQLVHGEKDTWLVASEFRINQSEALTILQRLDSENYSSDEVEVIVSNHVPFDLR
jgi:hypothetical protein